MNAIAQINRDVAAIIGDTDVDRFTDDLSKTWLLVEYATKRAVEYSLFAMIYDRHPIYMASFIRGLSQRTSTGECPMIATCKAFIMMFAPAAELNGDRLNH